ncbi:MAG: hypothetical protein HOP10_08865 [Chitinophagaceae bacterium]|nr:hypothetical protein [Chitinophagaceae bacterium]
MFKHSLIFLFSIVLLFACKQKKKEPEKKYISVLSLIRGQVAHVDTALYSIMRVEYIDSIHNDTIYIPREKFGEAAKDFLDIPDLSDQKIARRYKEESRYDATINKVVITYTPLYPKAEEVQKQELLITPDIAANDNVNNIIINRVISNRDSIIQKNMLWQIDKSFQVTTIRQLSGKPETITTIKVSWNEDPYQ